MPRLKTLLGFHVVPECKYQPETAQKEQYDHDGSVNVLPRALIIWHFVNRHWLAIAAPYCVTSCCSVLSYLRLLSSLNHYHGHATVAIKFRLVQPGLAGGHDFGGGRAQGRTKERGTLTRVWRSASVDESQNGRARIPPGAAILLPPLVRRTNHLPLRAGTD
jgi:hypothetical protein